MDSIFTGNIDSRRGRMLAWADSLLVDHGLLRLVWTNFATVSPGRLYRCNHPTPGRLAIYARRHGVRTVISLRGPCGNGSDVLSRAAARRLGLEVVDLPLRSRRAPQAAQILALLDCFATMREPAVVHCKSGADRAGLASALFLLANGASVREAQRQLTLRHGHLSRSAAGILGAFLHRYAAEGEGRKPFAAWLREDYDPAALAAAFRPSRFSGVISDRLLARE